jgi:hypothetical protein
MDFSGRDKPFRRILNKCYAKRNEMEAARLEGRALLACLIRKQLYRNFQAKAVRMSSSDMVFLVVTDSVASRGAALPCQVLIAP